MRLSASTLLRLEELWEVLPESLATSDGLGRPPFQGDDGGNPVLSCDTGRELLSRFEPLVMAGFGHLADLVVGPARGFAFSRDEEAGMQLLESIVAIDESRRLMESLPPRHGVAVFSQTTEGPRELIGQAWPSDVDAGIAAD